MILHDLRVIFYCFISEFQKDDSQRLLESFNCDEKEDPLTKSEAEPYTAKEEMVLEVKLGSLERMSILLNVLISTVRAVSQRSWL